MLDTQDAARVRQLAEEVALADGQAPLNEEALLALTKPDGAVGHHLRWSGTAVVGYAQSNSRLGTAQLMVHPGHRRRGLGGHLAGHVGDYRLWAFGDLAPAAGLAAALGLVERRRLLIMQKPLPPASGADHPGVRGFHPERDSDELLRVNAAAFDWHPEQRYFSRADLEARMREAWYDPHGLLVTEDDQGLTGFHWTKRHPDGRGEVYILATDPRAQGTGLGKRLLAAGLDHLAGGGASTVHLYVEAANRRAVELYDRAGFAVVHSDVLYGRPDSD